MKIVTAKIKQTVINKPYLSRKLMEEINNICINGTLNIRRIEARQITFKIDDRFETRAKMFLEFEDVSVQEVEKPVQQMEA